MAILIYIERKKLECVTGRNKYDQKINRNTIVDIEKI